MRKKVISIILFVLTLSAMVFSFTSCSNEKETNSETKRKYVQIEAYNANFEGKIEMGSYYFKYDGKPKVFDIKIYSLQDKRYLTNDDVVRKDLNSLIVVTITKYKQTVSKRIDISNPNEWPSEVGIYDVAINFNGWLLKDDEIDPKYSRGTPAHYFTIIIEENN